MIPAEAIEAAARAMNPAVWGPQVWTFQAHGETPAEARNRVQQEALQQARAALEAAAPYMQQVADDALRAAWDRGYAKAVDGVKDVPAAAWEEGYTLGYADCANKQESNRPNPYMLNTEGEK